MSAKTFSNLTSLKSAMKTNDVKFLDEIPYVQKDNQFFYFGVTEDGDFFLLMTSSRDLGETQA